MNNDSQDRVEQAPVSFTRHNYMLGVIAFRWSKRHNNSFRRRGEFGFVTLSRDELR
jgi:hypothetical protein